MTLRRFGLAIAFLLLAVLGYVAWLQLSVRMGGTPVALRGVNRTEEEWIVREIVTDVAQMSLAASGWRGAELAGLEVELEGAGTEWRAQITAPEHPVLEVPLRLVPYPWDPEAYSELAQAFSPANAPGSTLADPELLGRLLRATTQELIDEDFRVSDSLSADPGGGAAHEEAALLLAVVALRESAGEFTDLRPAFNRMTAHLAMASRSSAGSEVGRLAKAILLALAGRERDAEAEIAALESAEWRRILRMRLTDDWRLLDAPERATALEKLAWFRAMARTLDTTTAMERYASVFPEEEPGLDWYRQAIESFTGPSDGSYFRGGVLERQLEEIRVVRERYRDATRDLGAALNDPPRGFFAPESVVPRVLGWSYWAGFYQRQLCDHLVAADTYFRIALGLEDEARRHGARADARVSGMTLHPFVRMRRTARRGVKVENIDARREVVRVTARNPERVTSSNWYLAAWTTAQMALRQGMPRGAEWFSPALATTSAFDTRRRLIVLGRQHSPEDIAALQALSPNDDEAWRLFLELPRAEPMPVDSLFELMGPRREYDLVALRDAETFAERHDLDERPIRERMCAIDADACVHLGNLLVERNEEEDAVRAFRRAFDESADRVHVSNHMAWLVRYYRRNRNTGEAMIVARSGASTGSSLGLTTLARLLEDMGELAEAEELFKRDAERYEDEARLAGFYYRLARVRGLHDYEAKLASALEDFFPGRLRPYDETENETPPRDGVLINSNSDRLREAGLLPGDVVVALDRFRVRSFGQYEVVREFSESSEMKLVVWRVNRYLPVETEVRDRRFLVDMIDYRPRRSIDSLGN